MRKWLWTVLMAVCLAAVCGCGKLDDLRITSCRLADITPRGLRGLKAGVEVGVHNPAMKFTLTDICGTIYYRGEEYADFTAAPVSINKKSDEVYRLTIEARASEGTSVLKILNLLNGRADISQFAIDLETTAKARGMKKKFTLTKVPLDKITDNLKKYTNDEKL